MMPTVPAVTPPSTVETEQALLGAILINPEALDRARDHVVPADFFNDAHRQIFQVMCDRRDAGDAIDWKLMKAVLGDVDLGDITLGAYLAKLVSEAITVSGASGYARMIAEAARMRIVLETSQAAVARMTDGSVHDPAEYATFMIETLDEVASSRLAEHARRVTLGHSVTSVLARVDQARRTVGRNTVSRNSTLPLLACARLNSSSSPAGPEWARRR